MRVRQTTLLVVLLLMATVLASWSVASAQVRLSASASPSTSQPGGIVSVTGSSFPVGTVVASSVTVTLTPTAGGAATQTTATQIVVLTSTAKQVKFAVPSIVVAAPAAYQITVTGSSAGGSTPFTTAAPASLTINPPASLGAISPASASTGQTTAVTITGSYTHFSSVTRVSLGAGISVGGAAAGTAGPVTVNNTTSITAQISVAGDAAVGARDVTVQSSGEVVSKPAGFNVTQGATNHNPVANAGGPYNGQINQAISFNGSGSTDADGDTLTYAWNFGDGGTATDASPTHTYTAGGSFSATLTVDDGHGGSNAATVQVRVNRPPVANAGGPYNGQLNQAVSFSGSGSTDADGDTLTYAWNFGDGGTATTASPMHTYSAGGTFSATLTVDDGHGGTNAATVTVHVNRPPVANAGGPYNALLGASVNFNGGGSSDPDADTLTYAWDFGDGGTNTTASPSHSYAHAGAFTVNLTVNDQHGGSNSTSVQVHIDTPPVAHAGGPYSGTPNTPVSFNGSTSTDADGDTLLYSWDFGDNTPTATGATTSHTYASAGDYTVSLTVDDQHGGTNAVSVVAHIGTQSTNAPPAVTITSPVPAALFGTGTITVDGTVNDPDDSEVTVSVNGVTATVSGNTFHAEGIALHEGNNLVTATGTDPHGNAGSASVGVILDTTAPTIQVSSPTANASVTSPTVTISGIVNDSVPGTVNQGEVSVTVNGVAATVSNRSFALAGLPLVRGQNTIVAAATDRAGNTSQTQVTVTYSDTAGQRLVVLSGDNQAGTIGTTLANSLVVQLQNFTGVPVTGRPVTFRVTRSDGQLISQETQAQEITVNTDANGQASVQFQLGTRVGIGINQVTVTSAGVIGETMFSASSTAGAPASLKVVSGDQQRGAIGQNLAFPFVVVVLDAGGNPLSAVPVTFTVTEGGGNFGGNSTSTTNSDPDGKASAVLALGEQEGINNNIVTAAIEGVPPVSFNASGVVPGSAADTRVSGIVLDNSDGPIPNATATIVGTTLSTTTDEQGHFTINGAPVGTIMLLVDGRTSTRPEYFPFLNFQMTSIAGQDNTVGGPIYLPAIDRNSVQIVGGDQDVRLHMAGVQGVELTVFAHSAMFPDGSTSGPMYLSQVHSDKVPMPPPNGTAPLLTGTLQPAGVVFNPPVRVQFPNTDGLPPGTVVDVYSYDHSLEQFVSQGPARVSADGSVIVSDAGFGIAKSGWHAVPPPPPPTTCNLYCNDGNECTDDSVANPPCVCRNVPGNNGGNCGGTADSCTDAGHCANGRCDGNPKPEGSTCDDGLFCTEMDKCEGGACRGTAKKYPDPTEEDGPDFGGLKKLGEVVTKFLATTKIAGDNPPTFTLSWKIKNQQACCEQKQSDVTNRTDTITAALEFELAKHTISAPPWSGDYTVTVFGHSIGVNYGIQFGLSFSTSASLSRTKDGCTDQNCWGGSVTSTLTGTGALIAEVPNPGLSDCGENHNSPCDLLKLSATFTTSVSVTNGVDCHSIHGDATWGGLTLTPAVTLLEGTFLEYSSSIDIPLFGPVTLTSYDIPLPE